MTSVGKALAALACAAALSGAACQREAGTGQNVAVEYEISPQPPKVGPAVFSLKLTDAAASKPLSGARVRLEGNMTHAGMRPVFAEASEVGPGRYRADLQLTMAGDWVVFVRAELPGGGELERRFEVRGVEAE